MPGMSPITLVLLIAGALQVATGFGWWIASARLDATQTKLAKCNAKHEAFVDQVKVQGEAAMQAARTKEAEHRRIHDETSRAWAAALDVVRVQYAARPGPRGGGVSVTPVAADRVVIAPAEPLPAPERIIADCAEDTLKLVWLQHWVQEALP